MPNFAANLTMLFNELPFLERFEAAASAGFNGVEYLFPYDHSPEVLAGQLRRFGLKQVLFNLPAGDWAGGERGIACLPGREEEFRAGVDLAIRYAVALGCPQLNCLAGIAPEGTPPRVVHAVLRDNLRHAAEQLGAAGLRLLVEPVNTHDIPGFALSTSAEALGLIDGLGRPDVLLQYDVYHMQIMEGDLVRRITTCLDRIGHIQIADNPGRHEPGSGEINFPFLFNALDRLGYDGWVGCEYKPAGGTTEGLGWFARWRERVEAA